MPNGAWYSAQERKRYNKWLNMIGGLLDDDSDDFLDAKSDVSAVNYSERLTARALARWTSDPPLRRELQQYLHDHLQSPCSSIWSDPDWPPPPPLPPCHDHDHHRFHRRLRRPMGRQTRVDGKLRRRAQGRPAGCGTGGLLLLLAVRQDRPGPKNESRRQLKGDSSSSSSSLAVIVGRRRWAGRPSP
jgi:hypothetical protein